MDISDRFGNFTDIEALRSAHSRPLRKSLRVNTLKSTVEEVKSWGEEHGWTLNPVPWCPDGFFVERMDDRALGKNLFHQIGYIYLQEAASMLPVELLDPQPGEEILDLCAAPGSKTTQIAAKMKNTGVIIANDVQEKRLWTLQEALQRSGVLNTILTSKNGEWFGGNMTERFDRVLCDAPCSALGIARKDPTALKLCNEKSIAKLKSMQLKLLESAIHAAKIGGRIVYSTCTLTPEENEEVVTEMMEKFSGKIEIVDVRDKERGIKDLDRAIDDSVIVQKSRIPFPVSPFPLLRLWPHTYDTEGFFCAVFEKKDHTRDVLRQENAPPQRELTPSRTKDIIAELTKRYGTSFLRDNERLYETGLHVTMLHEEASRFILPCPRYAFGIPFLKLLKDSRIRLTHEITTFRGREASSGVLELTDGQKELILEGKDAPCNSELRGELILRWRGIAVGFGMAKEGVIKNWLPRRILQQISE